MYAGKYEGRMSPRGYGLSPGKHSIRALSDFKMYIIPKTTHKLVFAHKVAYSRPPELPLITPTNAPDYCFYTTDPVTGEALQLGWEAALDRFHSQGYMLASPEWMKTQWSLVLWKRAGMICCKPEVLIEENKWCFESIVENLLYQ